MQAKEEYKRDENRKGTKGKVKSKRENKKQNNNKMIIGAGIILLVGTCSIMYFNKNYVYNDAIAKNVFIEDIDLSNMSKEEALQAVTNKYTPSVMKLAYEDETFEIAPEDIDLKYNVEETIDEAYNFTKTDSYFNNVRAIIKLRNSKKEFDMKSTYDEAKLTQSIEKISNHIDVDMKNAKVYISDGGGISVSKSVIGKEFDVAKNKEAIYEMIQNKSYQELDLVVNTKDPDITYEAASSVNTLLAEYSTKFSTNQAGRVNNVALSAKKTSDVLLMPGEEFSYNNLTGNRTVSNGYKDAPVIVNGKLEDGIGGGVCQTSSTMFNSVLTSGLKITARTNHSLVSSYVPKGQDAMVNSGGSDFKFVNPYNHPIYVKNVVHNGVITSRIYGNAGDKQNITVKVDNFSINGKPASKTYREYRDNSGKIIRTEYVGQSVYKK